ncbi:MAG: nitroreductase [Flavobacteriaceae bacterium]|nr:nitroreductase [Flavobacteriaceae bacterium]
MNIIEAIRKRRSIMPEQFNSMEIDDNKLRILLESANWAPTHKKTEPWRFKVLKSQSKNELGLFLAEKYKQKTSNFSDFKYRRLIEKTKKSSVIILICMQRDVNQSIPEWEEIASVSMAVQNMWLAATELNIGGYWSSPPYIQNIGEFTKLNLGEKCLGIFYLGHYDKSLKNQRFPNPIDEKIVVL